MRACPSRAACTGALTSSRIGRRLDAVATSNVQRVLEMARTLSNKERAEIASELLTGLEFPGDELSTSDAEGPWREEARRRSERVVRDETKGIAAQDVHEEIERELANSP
jgi:hypothetical protein